MQLETYSQIAPATGFGHPGMFRSGAAMLFVIAAMMIATMPFCALHGILLT